MKTFINLVILLSLLSLSACNRDTEGEPEEPFDITQYVIVGLAKKTTAIHYIQTFEAQEQGVSMKYDAFFEERKSYTYNDGTLKIFFRTGELNKEFKIENKMLVYSSDSQYYKTYLVKIPSSNQLNGNVFSGAWIRDNNIVASLVNLRFTNTHFSEAALSPPEPTTEYQLIKNIGALSITTNSRRFWVFVDGKLEGTKLSSGVAMGSFIKQ